MAFQVNWTRRASFDLKAIEDFIAAEHASAAVHEIGNILRKIDVLEQFPKIGPVYRRTSDAEYRSVLSGKYRIVYFIRPGEDVVDVITIRHGAQDEPDLL